MTFILFTLRIVFKCPFGFGLLFVNNLLYVWYLISIFFLFLFLLVCCLLGAGIPVGRWYPLLFFGWYLFLITSSYFCLLMEPSALLAVLHVYSLRWLFIALPIFGVLKILVRPPTL